MEIENDGKVLILYCWYNLCSQQWGAIYKKNAITQRNFH